MFYCAVNSSSECERLRAQVMSQGVAQLASATQIRELRRRFFRLDVSGPALLKVLKAHDASEADKVIEETISQKDETKPPQYRPIKLTAPSVEKKGSE